MNIVFMGTPDFAVPTLEMLIKSEDNVCAVICQPDKPKGRSHELSMPPVKVKAMEHNIPVFQPNTLKNGAGVEILKSVKPDMVIVAAYGKILPKDFLEYPPYGCINVHGSLLPRYRGAAPIQWAILNGEKETGVTIMKMDVGLDTGDIIYAKKTEIGENETGEELFDRISVLGAEALADILPLIKSGKAEFTPQDEKDATYVGMLSRDMSNIDWNDTALNIHNKIRGLYSWPGASTFLNGKVLKIHRARLSDYKGCNTPGCVVFSDNSLIISCGDGKCVELTELQLEGKKRMSTEDFLRGRQIEKGTVLGE